MHSNLQQDRQAIHATRVAREETRHQLNANDLQLRAIESQVETALRAGAAEATIAALRDAEESARAERGGLLERFGRLERDIVEIIGGVVDSRTPEQMFGALDGRVPLALLPARIESRFFDNNRKLQIRIFPDQINIDSHIPELTGREVELGRWYWTVRGAAEAEQGAGAWQELTRRLGAPRAAWVVERLTPENLQADGHLPPDEAPRFPDPAVRPDGSGRAPRAVVLPDRWVVVGLKRRGATGYEPIFRKWGATVPDALNVGPSFERLAEISQAPDELPIEPEMRWTVDYAAAEQVGMAITVRDADLAAGNRLASGVDLLVVLGMDWTLTPVQGAANLDALLDAHRFGEGLAFVPQGTPTNNTADARSGVSTAPGDEAALFDPAHPPAVDSEHGAGPRLAAALGLPAGQSGLERIAGAGLSEQRLAATLIEALWQSTLGYYLDILIDPLATDQMVALARDHTAKYLRPSGPFSVLRVGPQPYGVLPVLSLGHFKADRPSGVESALQRLLNVGIWYWRDGIGDVPQMGRSADPDRDLLDLLQMTPVAAVARFRQALDTETVADTDGLKRLAMIQADILRSLVLPNFASLTGPLFNVARITQLALYPTYKLLRAPWVAPGTFEPGAPLSRNYVAEIARLVRAGSDGRAGLDQASRSTDALLEQLLALAALREVGQGVDRSIVHHLLESGFIQELPARASLRVGSTLGVYTTPEQGVQGQLHLQTPEQQSRLVIPALSGSETVVDFVTKQIFTQPERPEVHNLVTFLASLDDLAARPVAEIDWMLRALLDCYSHRYDAWVTSLATRRLEGARAVRPAGLHVGGYGWLENLRPDSRPDSLGYVHAPSLNHAAAAALMRSGHLSHRSAEGAALDIDLSSERVRRGLSLIEGVAQGQPLAALLGYRFERGLRERGIALARFILPIRLLAPYRTTVPGTDSEPRESIAARDVVDGVALLDRWRADGEALINGLNPLNPTPDERSAIAAELARLEDHLDAVSDLLTAESVYQSVLGNYERAGAALSARDRQGRPPDPQVIRTPRSGLMYMQRLLLLLQSPDPAPGWTAAALQDLRGRVEPRLNRWIGERLGDPTGYTLAARVVRRVPTEAGVEETVVETLSATLDELGISPLSIVLASVATHAERPSELELRLAHLFAARMAAPDPDLVLELLDEPPPGAAGSGLGALRAFVQMIHAFLGKRRALDARDLYPPEGEPPSGIDLAELSARLETIARPAHQQAVSALEGALAAPTFGALQGALVGAAALGLGDALPDVMLEEEGAVTILVDQATRVLERVRATAARLTETIAAFSPPPPEDASRLVRQSEHVIACLRLLLGEEFPILPLFTPANQAELAASRADREALLAGDPFVPLTWMQQMATTRPEVDALVSVLTASDLLGTGISADDIHVMQLPHVPGQAWAALTRPESSPLLALVAVGRSDPDQPVAGLICDGWSEIIPARSETTGLTFHYDAPAARPPQAILVAVPPDLSKVGWSFEAALDSVLESFELMKLRAVGPRQIRALGGGILPALYLPQDNSFQVPAVDLLQLLEAHVISGTHTLGKAFSDATEP